MGMPQAPVAADTRHTRPEQSICYFHSHTIISRRQGETYFKLRFFNSRVWAPQQKPLDAADQQYQPLIEWKISWLQRRRRHLHLIFNLFRRLYWLPMEETWPDQNSDGSRPSCQCAMLQARPHIFLPEPFDRLLGVDINITPDESTALEESPDPVFWIKSLFLCFNTILDWRQIS